MKYQWEVILESEHQTEDEVKISLNNLAPVKILSASIVTENVTTVTRLSDGVVVLNKAPDREVLRYFREHINKRVTNADGAWCYFPHKKYKVERHWGMPVKVS